MTDEEIGRAINAAIKEYFHGCLRLTEEAEAVMGKAARELLTPKPVATREAVLSKWAEIRNVPNDKILRSYSKEYVSDLVTLISHFAPPAAPISGMTVEEITQQLSLGWDAALSAYKKLHTNQTPAIVDIYAIIAHHLAQPPAVVDEDAAAKAAQRAYTEDFFPDDEHLRPTWERISEQERNGWRRAVAAAREGKDG